VNVMAKAYQKGSLIFPSSGNKIPMALLLGT